MRYFYRDFRPDELSVLFLGFQRNLFTRPKEKEMLSVELPEFGAGCTIFFEEDFLNNLIGEYKNAKVRGLFASSNANSKWLTILNLLHWVTPAEENQYENAKDYSDILKGY